MEACQCLDGLLFVVPCFASLKVDQLDDGFVKVAGGWLVAFAMQNWRLQVRHDLLTLYWRVSLSSPVAVRMHPKYQKE
jgi:hypothetical protein